MHQARPLTKEVHDDTYVEEVDAQPRKEQLRHGTLASHAVNENRTPTSSIAYRGDVYSVRRRVIHSKERCGDSVKFQQRDF